MKKIILLISAIICLTGCGTQVISNEKGNTVEEWNQSGNNQNTTDEENAEIIEVNKGEAKDLVANYNNKEIKANINLNNVFYTTQLTPPSPTQRFYSSYKAESGKVYEVVELTIKNTGTDFLGESALTGGYSSRSCTPTFVFDGGYKYTGVTAKAISQDNEGNYDLDSFYGLDPLEENRLYLFTSVPDEVKDLGINVSLCFGNTQLKLNW